jgi:hypothetical protein
MDEKDNAALERGAANDIVRLRWRLQIRENIIGRLVAETERLRNGAAASCETVTLTDEERAAIELAISKRLDMDAIYTLRNLLERLK